MIEFGLDPSTGSAAPAQKVEPPARREEACSECTVHHSSQSCERNEISVPGQVPASKPVAPADSKVAKTPVEEVRQKPQPSSSILGNCDGFVSFSRHCFAWSASGPSGPSGPPSRGRLKDDVLSSRDRGQIPACEGLAGLGSAVPAPVPKVRQSTRE